jgi:S1-C subfamily serine protease
MSNDTRSQRALLDLRAAVIYITCTTPEYDWQRPYNTNMPSHMSHGTAFVMKGCPQKKDAIVALTAYHCVDRAVKIEAKLHSSNPRDEAGGRAYSSRVIAYSQSLDAALIEIDCPYPENLKPIAQGSSDHLITDDKILVAGFPLQENFSVTTGFVSSRQDDVIRIDASVSPGNSGGPVILDRDQTVIGILHGSFSDVNAQNMNLVYPITEIIKVLLHNFSRSQLSSTKPFVSISASSFNFVLSSSTPRAIIENVRADGGEVGSYCEYVTPFSNAYKIGLREGDIVCSIDGYQLDVYGRINVPWWKLDALSYHTLLGRKSVGSETRIKFFSMKNRKMIGDTRTDSGGVFVTQEDLNIYKDIDLQKDGSPYWKHRGVVLQPLTKQMFYESGTLSRRLYFLMSRPSVRLKSLLVCTHVGDSPFSVGSRGLKPNDVIVAVNDTPVNGGDLVSFQLQFDEAILSGCVKLTLYTGDIACASSQDLAVATK